MTDQIILSTRSGDSLVGKYVALISDADADLKSYNWSALETASGLVYAYRKAGKNDSEAHQSNIYLHRVIATRMAGKVGKSDVDHIDGNGLNCTRDNLRIATRSQNRVNSRPSSRNTTGYRGVTKSGDSYVA